MKQPFDMFEITEQISLEIRSHPTKPHRHEYEELLIITAGRPVNYIDFLNETVDAPVVVGWLMVLGSVEADTAPGAVPVPGVVVSRETAAMFSASSGSASSCPP
jgi:hypothetical protein